MIRSQWIAFYFLNTNSFCIVYKIENVSAMAFGRLGQEDHVLVLITIGK